MIKHGLDDNEPESDKEGGEENDELSEEFFMELLVKIGFFLFQFRQSFIQDSGIDSVVKFVDLAVNVEDSKKSPDNYNENGGQRNAQVGVSENFLESEVFFGVEKGELFGSSATVLPLGVPDEAKLVHVVGHGFWISGQLLDHIQDSSIKKKILGLLWKSSSSPISSISTTLVSTPSQNSLNLFSRL